MKKVVETNKAPTPVGPYSQAVLHKEWLWLSGQIPINPQTGQLVTGDIQAQTQQVMENIKAVLQKAGCNFNHVIKTTIFLTNMDDFAKVNQVYQQYFKSPFPARSCVSVASLPKAVNVEIELIAHCPD